MTIFAAIRHTRTWLFAILAGAALLSAGACNTYYIPPPPLEISLSAPGFNSNLVISSLNSNGQLQPSTLALNGTVINSTNTTIVYSVGQNGVYIEGGNATWGYISSTGVYTAPLVIPTPNKVVVKAAAQADLTQTATVTLTLFNPSAEVTAATPSLVTTGLPASFDITGTSFASGATANLSGAVVTQSQLVSSTEMKITAQIQQPGILGLSVLNPFPYRAPNAFLVRSLPSSPATSSALAVTVGPAGKDSSGNVITATKGYVPQGASVAVVNLDTNQQIGLVNMPTGYSASLAAADPAESQIIVASTASSLLQVVSSTTDSVSNSLPVPVATSTTVGGITCRVCAMLVDSARHTAILSTAAGLLTVDLDSGLATTPLAVPATLNLTYDASTQRVFVPYADSNGSGVKVIDLQHGTIADVTPTGALFGTATAAAAWDATSGILTAGDAVSGTFLNLNLNNAQISGATVQAAATPFSVTTGCAHPWRGMDVDLAGHLGWLANTGSCIAVAGLAQGPVNGSPAPPTPLAWARVPLSPDGLPWQNAGTGRLPALTAYTGSDGRAYGISLRQDGAMLLKVDLALMQQAPAVPGGADANQVDPTQATQNGQTVSALTYIPLH